jgi:hypothetical protein
MTDYFSQTTLTGQYFYHHGYWDGTSREFCGFAQITARCEELAATRDLVREFADMLCHRHGKRLEAWADQAEVNPVSELRGSSKRLRKDGPQSPPGPLVLVLFEHKRLT